MTEELSLVLRDDFSSDIDELDLMPLIARDGYMQAIAREDEESVDEVITLNVPGTSHDDLATMVQAIDEMVRRVKLAKNPVERYSVWLRVKMNNETNARQALVLEARRGKARVRSMFARHENILDEYQIGITRREWESPTVLDYDWVSGSAFFSLVGGMWDYTTYSGSPGSVPGDTPARLALTSFFGPGGGAPAIERIWIGFRSDLYGDRTRFEPAWDTALGTLENDTVPMTDPTARSGTRTQCTFGNASMLPRVTIQTSEVTSFSTDQRGEYIVLLRARCTEGSTVCPVRLTDGWYTSAVKPNFGSRHRTPVNTTDWNFYEMGRVRLPPVSGGVLLYASQPLTNYALRLEASRTAGTGDLCMDCLILIPAAEGWIYFEQAAVINTDWVTAAETSRGEKIGIFGNVQPKSSIPVQIGGGLPLGGGIVVAAGQPETLSDLADEVRVRLAVYPRWHTLRGSDG